MSETSIPLDDQRIAQILQTFKSFDKDGDGSLSPSEMATAARFLGKSGSEEEIMELFKQMDHNGDGVVSLIEFTEIMGHKDDIDGYHRFFKEMDKDDSGFLSAKEILAVLKKSGISNPKEEVTNMFNKARKKADDELSFEEFVSLMIFGIIIFPANKTSNALSVDKLNELRAAFDHFDNDGSGKISFDEFKNLVTRLGKQVTDEGLKELLKEADTNGDGEIGFAEFISIMGYADDIAIFRNAFRSIDTDRSGMVEEEELARLLTSMKIPKAKSEAKKIIKKKKKLTKNAEKGINFDEFVELMFRY